MEGQVGGADWSQVAPYKSLTVDGERGVVGFYNLSSGKKRAMKTEKKMVHLSSNSK